MLLGVRAGGSPCKHLPKPVLAGKETQSHRVLLAQDEAARGADDNVDEFRQKMAARKWRSKQFLENPTALFNLLFSLAMNFLIDVPMKICFLLFDSDKQGLGIANPRKEERQQKRRRLRCKGANVFDIPPFDSQKKYELNDLHVSSMKVVDYIWQALSAPLELSVFQVPAMFWPQDRSASDMYRFMSGDMLQALAAFKWRVSYKFYNPPYCLLAMISPDCSLETQACLTQKFLDMPACCLSQFWGQPVKEELAEEAAAEGVVPVDLLKFHVQKFAQQSRPVSIREERQHSLQRTFAGGWRAKARSFWQQACQSVLANAAKNCFARRQGLHQKQRQADWKKLKSTVRIKKIVHKRPKQCGNPVFYFVATRIAQCSQKTKDELREDWKAMSAAEKQDWKWRQSTAVAKRRQAQQVVHARCAEDMKNLEFDTPWGLGDDEHPLRPEFLSEYLAPFRTESAGLAALRQMDSTHPAVSAYLDKMDSGEVKFHSQDAAVAFSKAVLGKPVTADNSVGVATWTKAETCPAASATCFDAHPGLCRGSEKPMVDSVANLVARIPRKDSVLMLSFSGVPAAQKHTFFVRLVIGRADQLGFRLGFRGVDTLHYVRVSQVASVGCKLKLVQYPKPKPSETFFFFFFFACL